MNRNKMMTLNGVVVILTTVSGALLGMIEISLLLKHYGPAINGLIQTGNQLLHYILLIESGLCAAFLCKMYKPIAEDNSQQLSSLYVGFRKSMRSVVYKMLFVAVIVSAIYPLFIKEKSVGYAYTFSIFCLLSLKTILPYLVTMVPKYMLIVKEQKYKAEFISGICRIATYLIVIFLMILNEFVKIPIQVVLGAGVLVAFVTGLWFQKEMNKLYHNTLDLTVEPDVTPNHMSKDLLVHNVSGMVFNSTDNIIISTLSSLKNVTIYSSYNMIVGQVSESARKFMDGATASLGIKIARKENNSYAIYREMLVGSLWLGGIIGAVFAVMMNDFVEIWIGKEYWVGKVDLILFALIMYCGILLSSIQVVRNACGLYKESRNFTAAQAVVNLVITLLLVPKLGITGALIGTAFARMFITVPCNYLLVEKNVFAKKKTDIAELVIGVVLLMLVAFGTSQFIDFMPVLFDNLILQFLFKAVLSAGMIIILYTLYYWIINTGFREFVGRILKMFKKK